MRLTFYEILHNFFWVSWGVLFKGLGVQKDTQAPCWLRLWLVVKHVAGICLDWQYFRSLGYQGSSVEHVAGKCLDWQYHWQINPILVLLRSLQGEQCNGESRPTGFIAMRQHSQEWPGMEVSSRKTASRQGIGQQCLRIIWKPESWIVRIFLKWHFKQIIEFIQKITPIAWQYFISFE